MNIGIIGLGIQGKIRFKTIKEINSNYRVTMVSDINKPKDIDLGRRITLVRCDVLAQPVQSHLCRLQFIRGPYLRLLHHGRSAHFAVRGG